jgi:hypothetical protein
VLWIFFLNPNEQITSALPGFQQAGFIEFRFYFDHHTRVSKLRCSNSHKPCEQQKQGFLKRL